MAGSVVRRGDRWVADGGEVRLVVHPDGRRYLRPAGDGEALTALVGAVVADAGDEPLHAMVRERDAELRNVLAAAGFAEVRREGEYRVPVVVPGFRFDAEGYELVSAADADLERLRVLDEAVRDDIPGSEGWRWTPEEFRRATLDDTEFDPRTYLVAARRDTGAYVGLVRVWMKPDGPRLGCVGVLGPYRRGRVTAALLGTVLAELAGRGHRTMVAEVTDTNRASLALLARAGAVRTDTYLELVRPAG